MTTIKNYRMSALALLAMLVVCTAIPAYAQFSVMYNFGSVGGDPELVFYSGLLAQGRDGSLYSTSSYGGVNSGFNTGNQNAGTVFKITPEGRLKVLYSFCSQTNCADGFEPNSGLILRPDGHFLGNTRDGGNNSCAGYGCGTIFDISPTGQLTTLYSFTGGPDGASPGSSLSEPPVLGTDGNFYGVATFGGRASQCGTLYRITGNVFTLLYQFDTLHGCEPGQLVLGTDGNFYGTGGGGAVRLGVVFKVTLRPGQATVVTVLYSFDGTHGSGPSGPLVQGSDGSFYGTTWNGGAASAGVVFKITPTGTLTVLHSLNGTTDGSNPVGLVQASDGNFYGAAALGGGSANCTGGCGTLFRVTPAGDFSVLYNFDGTTGNGPHTPFQHTNGRLYGDTYFGGTGGNAACAGTGCGVFFSFDAGLPPFVSTVPFMGKVGSFVEILGQGFTSATTVSFNGTPATATVVSGTYLHATVPAGATTGPVTVTNSSGTLTSNQQFVVTP